MASTLNIKFGGNRRISISPLTVVYYDEAFSKHDKEADVISDFMSISQISTDLRRLSGIKIMRIVWAAEKTYKNGIIEPFNVWVKMLPSIDLGDSEMWESLSVAITDEFFRSDRKTEEKEKDDSN